MAEMRQSFDEAMTGNFKSSILQAAGLMEALRRMNAAVFGYRDCGSDVEQYEKYTWRALHWRKDRSFE